MRVFVDMDTFISVCMCVREENHVCEGAFKGVYVYKCVCVCVHCEFV